MVPTFFFFKDNNTLFLHSLYSVNSAHTALIRSDPNGQRHGHARCGSSVRPPGTRGRRASVAGERVKVMAGVPPTPPPVAPRHVLTHYSAGGKSRGRKSEQWSWSAECFTCSPTAGGSEGNASQVSLNRNRDACGGFMSVLS